MRIYSSDLNFFSLIEGPGQKSRLIVENQYFQNKVYTLDYQVKDIQFHGECILAESDDCLYLYKLRDLKLSEVITEKISAEDAQNQKFYISGEKIQHLEGTDLKEISYYNDEINIIYKNGSEIGGRRFQTVFSKILNNYGIVVDRDYLYIYCYSSADNEMQEKMKRSITGSRIFYCGNGISIASQNSIILINISDLSTRTVLLGGEGGYCYKKEDISNIVFNQFQCFVLVSNQTVYQLVPVEDTFVEERLENMKKLENIVRDMAKDKNELSNKEIQFLNSNE